MRGRTYSLIWAYVISRKKFFLTLIFLSKMSQFLVFPFKVGWSLGVLVFKHIDYLIPQLSSISVSKHLFHLYKLWYLSFLTQASPDLTTTKWSRKLALHPRIPMGGGSFNLPFVRRVNPYKLKNPSGFRVHEKHVRSRISNDSITHGLFMD